MKKEYTCIVCPNGCAIEAEYSDGGDDIIFRGALCRRGEAYVRQELTDPRRTISSSALVKGGEKDLVSLRLTSPIPLAMIDDAMEEIKKLRIEAPVSSGDILIKDLLGTGSDVIATRDVEKKNV